MKRQLPKLTAEHIMYGIAMANALRLAWAYAMADAGGEVVSLPGAFGLLLGATVSIGTAFISGKLGGRLTKGRKALTWTVFVILLALEPFVLAPITMSHISKEMLSTLGPGFAWGWAITLALVPSLVLAGVAVANGGLVEAAAQQPPSASSDSTSEPAPRSTRKSGRSAKPAVAPATVACRYAGAGCERTGSQNAMNAHARSCEFKPTIAMPREEAKQRVQS